MLLWLSGKVEKICAVEIANSRNFGRASLSLSHLSFPFGAHRGRSLFESWFAYSSSIQWRFPQWDPITIMTIKHANYFMVVPANSTRCPWKTASSLSSSLRVMEKRPIHAEKEMRVGPGGKEKQGVLNSTQSLLGIFCTFSTVLKTESE